MQDQAAEGDSAAGPRSFARRVFYIPGYDPFHPRRYRELYRTEASAQAAIPGSASASSFWFPAHAGCNAQHANKKAITLTPATRARSVIQSGSQL